MDHSTTEYLQQRSKRRRDGETRPTLEFDREAFSISNYIVPRRDQAAKELVTDRV
ncbi:unnamed protein product, partial [Allacma fusca]